MGIWDKIKELFKRFSWNERQLRRYFSIVEKINVLEEEVKKWPDRRFREKTVEFRERLKSGESLDDILVEAFACVREAARRTLGMRHFDVQLAGGIALHEGKIIEMKTGEGKTLVATLPAYLNGLMNRLNSADDYRPVHIVTVNEYLAKRDAKWMGEIYRFLAPEGEEEFAVGVILHEMGFEEKKRAYRCNIVYGMNSEFGFDYLRDNMAMHPDEIVQTGHWYAIVDEVDSILIDEARTPLIISGASEGNTKIYYIIASVARHFKKGVHFELDEKHKAVNLTEEGYKLAEELLTQRKVLKGSLYHPENYHLVHYLIQALRALHLFKRDVDYVVKDGEVIIVDEFTGRLMHGRRWSDGLHQAVEAKEGVEVHPENRVLATISLQNYFRLYKKLAGMTGTAASEAREFGEIYGCDVVVIPTNKPVIREDLPDVVYKTKREKYHAVIDEIKKAYSRGQPVLVGTTSIEVSEGLAAILKREGVPCQVLNAKYHEKEAQIIKEAGRPFAVTIATNMAGRGTDIILKYEEKVLCEFGDKATSQEIEKCLQTLKEALSSKKEGEYFALFLPKSWLVYVSDNLKNEGVEFSVEKEFDPDTFARSNIDVALVESDSLKLVSYIHSVRLGGLYVIGTERHEARRIDDQLRGRSGRQGDPGKSRFFLSLEDDLMRLFGGDMVKNLMDRLGIPEGEPIESGLVTRAIETAQRRVENHNFEIRKHLLKYDDVLNKQRQALYRLRKEILEAEDTTEYVKRAIEFTVENLVNRYVEEAEVADFEALAASVYTLFGLRVDPEELKKVNVEFEGGLVEWLKEHLFEIYNTKKNSDIWPHLEKFVILSLIDRHWQNHLTNMHELQEGIGLRGLAAKDPLLEYKLEGARMFDEMIERLREDIASTLLRIEVAEVEEKEREVKLVKNEYNAVGAAQARTGTQGSGTYRRKQPKVGRNDPCPCGSGKKYKHCCGRNV